MASTLLGAVYQIMWYDKKKLEAMSIADLKAIRDYCLYQAKHRGWEINKWSYVGRIVIDELEKRIDECFRVS